jgi:hypothetical protein
MPLVNHVNVSVGVPNKYATTHALSALQGPPCCLFLKIRSLELRSAPGACQVGHVRVKQE